MRAVYLAFPLLMACGAEPEPTPADSDSATPVEDVQVEGTVVLALSFGFDATLGEIVATIHDGQDQPSTFVAYLGDLDWTGELAETDRYCTLSWDLDGLRAADWTGAGWFGWTGLDPALGTTDCDNPDPALDLLEAVSDQAWTFTFGGEMDPSLADLLSPSLNNPADVHDFFGGDIAVDFLREPLLVYGQGFAVDDDGALLTEVPDMATPIPPTEIATESGLATGWYRVHIPWVITLQGPEQSAE